GFATLVVQRIGGTVNPVSVNFHTVDATASSVDPDHPDYISASGTLFFQGDQYLLATNGSGALEFHAGESNQTIRIQIFDDLIGEGNETVNVLLSNPVGPVPPFAFHNATLLGSPSNALVTILDNDTPRSLDYEFNPD